MSSKEEQVKISARLFKDRRRKSQVQGELSKSQVTAVLLYVIHISLCNMMVFPRKRQKQGGDWLIVDE